VEIQVTTIHNFAPGKAVGSGGKAYSITTSLLLQHRESNRCPGSSRAAPGSSSWAGHLFAC